MSSRRVRFMFEVIVDQDVWEDFYGVGLTSLEFQADITHNVLNVLCAHESKSFTARRVGNPKPL